MKKNLQISRKASLLFTSADIERLEKESSLPAKFERMLSKIHLARKVKNKTVAIKMHLGDSLGYTTIHPVFVRILVEAIKKAGAKSVCIMDIKDIRQGIVRGYIPEIVGCPVVPCFGEDGKYGYSERIGFKKLDTAIFSGAALDSDVFISLAHIKGHGACGFGGAVKNIGMGLVTERTRQKLHRLEGGLKINRKKCKYCLKCFRECQHKAILKNDETKEISFFFHDCIYCGHCVMICPEGAITRKKRTYEDFSEGMARVASSFLKKFTHENLLFINFLTNITIYCDCWGFSTPSLVPDVGIIMGEDITAVDSASLDMIKDCAPLPGSIPPNFKFHEQGRHLFEKLHGKDPYLALQYLTQFYDCTMGYTIKEVK